MPKLLYVCLALFLVQACKPTEKVVKQETPVTSAENQYKLLQGKWQLTSFSAFMAEEDMAKMPDYSQKKVLYSFLLNDSKIIVSRDHEPSNYDYALPSGEYKIWANRNMVKIEDQLYMYHFNRNELVLDSNYDPSYGPDGPVLSFQRPDN